MQIKHDKTFGSLAPFAGLYTTNPKVVPNPSLPTQLLRSKTSRWDRQKADPEINGVLNGAPIKMVENQWVTGVVGPLSGCFRT